MTATTVDPVAPLRTEFQNGSMSRYKLLCRDMESGAENSAPSGDSGVDNPYLIFVICVVVIWSSRKRFRLVPMRVRLTHIAAAEEIRG